MGVSYRCWQGLGLPLQHQSHIAAFYQACTWTASTSPDFMSALLG